MDYNEAGPQKNFEPIPDRTVVPVQLTVRPGEIGEGGWLTRSKDGASEGLDCEFIVTEGEYAKRKFWGRFTIGGATPKHTEAGEITRRMLRAILESARNFGPMINQKRRSKRVSPNMETSTAYVFSCVLGSRQRRTAIRQKTLCARSSLRTARNGAPWNSLPMTPPPRPRGRMPPLRPSSASRSGPND
jgi:hypothetical protein